MLISSTHQLPSVCHSFPSTFLVFVSGHITVSTAFRRQSCIYRVSLCIPTAYSIYLRQKLFACLPVCGALHLRTSDALGLLRLRPPLYIVFLGGCFPQDSPLSHLFGSRIQVVFLGLSALFGLSARRVRQPPAWKTTSFVPRRTAAGAPLFCLPPTLMRLLDVDRFCKAARRFFPFCTFVSRVAIITTIIMWNRIPNNNIIKILANPKFYHSRSIYKIRKTFVIQENLSVTKWLLPSLI